MNLWYKNICTQIDLDIQEWLGDFLDTTCPLLFYKNGV